MSSSFSRRLAYQIPDNAKPKARATTSKFTKPGPKPVLTDTQEKERGVVEQTAKEGESSKTIVDEQLNKHENKEPDQKDFTSSKVTTMTKVETKTSHEVTPVLGSVYAKYWGHVSDRTIPKVTYSSTNFYLPSAIGMMQVINAMHLTLNHNERLRWIAPTYLSLPVTLYYSVLFHVQVLRAQAAAKTISKDDSSWLRGFLRIYGEESLPIAGPLVPFFNAIVAVLTESTTFDWIVPQFPTAFLNAARTLEEHHQLIPNVPALVDLLRFYCITDLNRGTHFHGQDLIKFSFTNGGTLGGISVPANGSNTNGWIYTCPGLDNPFPESVDQWIEARGQWSRSKMARVPEITTTTPLTRISEWLCMSNSYVWFGDCVKMAALQSKFFSDGKNLSQINTTGGLDVVIKCDYSPLPNDNSGGTAPANPTSWYPGRFQDLKAKFSTSVEETTTEDMWNAFTTQILASGPRVSDDTPYGKKTVYRDGEFWKERDRFVDTVHHEVSTNLETLIISQFYNADGEA